MADANLAQVIAERDYALADNLRLKQELARLNLKAACTAHLWENYHELTRCAKCGAYHAHKSRHREQENREMVALNFKAQFADDVECRRKCRSIRALRKDGRDPKVGDDLQLYTGMRQKGCRKLDDVICTRVRPVEIDHAGITLNGQRLYAGHALAYTGGVDPEQYDGDFARADGFDGFSDMSEFFQEQHGLPFKGLLIEWR